MTLLPAAQAVLACTGAGEVVAPAPDPVPAPEPPPPPAPPTAVPTSAEAPGPLGSPQIFLVQLVGNECAWMVWDADRHARRVGVTSRCPSEVRWSPDGAETLAIGGGEVIIGDWPLGKDHRVVTAPAEASAIWRTAKGEVRVASLLTATVKRDGDSIVYTAGTDVVKIPAEGEVLGKYGVRGTKAVAAGAGDRDVELLPGGVDQLAAFYALQDDGSWKRLALLPARSSLEFANDPLVVGGPLREEPPGWASLKELLAKNDAKDREPPPELQENAGLRAVVGARTPDDHVGLLPFLGGALLYLHQVGDTPHAMSPIAWCADPACTHPDPLPVDEPQLRATVNAGLVLITREYDGNDARVFAGSAAPRLVLPEAEHAVWSPTAAWLGPTGHSPREEGKAKTGKRGKGGR
jgi:hypothetical protein